MMVDGAAGVDGRATRSGPGGVDCTGVVAGLDMSAGPAGPADMGRERVCDGVVE